MNTKKILIGVICLFAFFVGNAQTFLQATTGNSVKISDYQVGVQDATGNTTTLSQGNDGTAAKFALSATAFVAASNGEYIKVTCLKTEGAFKQGQVIVFNRDKIKSVVAVGVNSKITWANSGNSFAAAESYSVVAAMLSAVASGGSGTFVALSGDVASGANGGATFIQTGAVTSAKVLDGSLVAADFSLGVNATLTQVTTNQTNLNNAYSTIGVPLSATNLGTFFGSNIIANTYVKPALQGLSDAIDLNKILFKQSGASIGTVGKYQKYNFIGATLATNGTDPTQVDITIAGGATTNTLTGNLASGIVSTVNGQVATLTPPTGVIASNLGFASDGSIVKQIPTAASGLLKYDAGNSCIVTATGAGVTFTRNNVATYTFSVPNGVTLLSFKINTTAASFMGSNVTINYNYTGNTLTNQGVTTQEPPTVSMWSDFSTAWATYPTGGNLSANFRPTIQTVSGGNISILYTLPSGVTSGATTLVGNF